MFWGDADNEAFIKVLQETLELWNMRTSAYCLMPNHYHLLVQTPDGNLARCMHHVNGVYTQLVQSPPQEGRTALPGAI